VKRMNRIGEPEMGEGIRDQQVAEIIRAGGRRDREVWKQRQPQRNRQNRQQRHAQACAWGEFPKVGFDTRTCDVKQHQKCCQQQFDKVRSPKSKWIAERLEGLEDGHSLLKRSVSYAAGIPGNFIPGEGSYSAIRISLTLVSAR